MLSVKDVVFKTTVHLTSEGHIGEDLDDQALAGEMNPNLVRALIHRGALR